jgi:acyl-CoA synthetase (AMP-forming)/AMP-acid ligase II
VYIIYTGGTTGLPKGVMWRCEDLFMAFGGGNPFGPPRATPAEVIDAARAGGGLVMMTAAPLMHGAAQMTTFLTWWQGGTVVYNRRFDPAEVLRTVERERVVSLGITGDAMARPLVDEIAAGTYDLSSLAAVSSTGAILSGPVRERLTALLPDVRIIDSFGSTESGYTAAGVESAFLRYRPNTPNLRVLDENLRPVPPGGVGQVAKSGHIALGYWNDPEKTSRTFVESDGVRWLLTGDIATVEDDGTIAVLGRGSQCINTGGEKVFPEEVEAVLKAHPSVFDAVVTGVRDELFGERVAAVIQPYGAPVAPEDLDAHCRSRLSGYKVPRTYAFVEKLERSPAGKADYRWARRIAENT